MRLLRQSRLPGSAFKAESSGRTATEFADLDLVDACFDSDEEVVFAITKALPGMILLSLRQRTSCFMAVCLQHTTDFKRQSNRSRAAEGRNTARYPTDAITPRAPPALSGGQVRSRDKQFAAAPF